MNEYKFRGKTFNGKWVYGYYIRHETRQICPLGDDNLEDNEILHLIAKSGFADWNMPRQLEYTQVIPETVGQFTGKLDKNGKEIYEGDIVIVTYGKCHINKNGLTRQGTIVYDTKTAAFRISVKDSALLVGFYEVSNIEVINNIYESEEI
jgi:uncharacterized phage protein (TIGR01671 family)